MHTVFFTTKIEVHSWLTFLVLEAVHSSPRNIDQALMLGDTKCCQLWVGPSAGKGSAVGPAWYISRGRMIWKDPVVLEISFLGKDVIWSLWKANHRHHNGIINQGYTVYNIKLNAFWEIVLTCWGALVETNCLAMRQTNKQANKQNTTSRLP